MVFTSQIFLFVFFPLCMIFFLIADGLERIKGMNDWIRKLRLKDLILIGFSFGFYLWACFDDIFWLILFILTVYLFSVIISRSVVKKYYITLCSEENGTPEKRFYCSWIPLVLSLLLIVLCLVYYKYFSFLSGLGSSFIGTESSAKTVFAPLGISFISFSAISYLVDIYKGKGKRGSVIDCALYISFFPKVVSGPIVLWRDFEKQICGRKLNLDQFSEGIRRIMIGFAKKVLLADTFGKCLADIGGGAVDPITAVGIFVLYALQIYYDFSGYSDIAIGVARIFGFNFKENFNFPYRSLSISEFWRRWHISLGTWFREYIYFPLGGSRVALSKTLRNLGIVFLLTGIWHGAGWNYILWGICHGACVILERVTAEKVFYQKIPSLVKWFATMLIVTVLWQCFRFTELGDIVLLIKAVFGVCDPDQIFYSWQYYFDAQIFVFALLGILGATVWGHPKLQEWYYRMTSGAVGYFVSGLVFLFLFIISIIFMVSSTYSPFIYFQY